jgi:2-amino-4-hydroxy-6-hydroxymethyldihydropteridine diphosphokinase
VQSSSILETDPVGGPVGQPRFLNAVARVETKLALRALFDALQSIERAHGRDRSAEVANGPRVLDLDLLLFGDARRDDPDLRVPHPRFEDRLFVLLPMRELAPDLVLPHSRTTVAERVRALSADQARDGEGTADEDARRRVNAALESDEPPRENDDRRADQVPRREREEPRRTRFGRE